MANITISTDEVASLASGIEALNQQLLDTLNESQETIKGLGGVWEGEAYQETLKVYNSFASKYFQNYHDVIDSYVKFLRSNVEAGYTQTETANVSLADSFKV